MMGTCSECFHWEACRCVVRAHGKSPMAFEYYLGACCPRFADKTKYVEQKRGQWENVTGGMIMLGDCSECKERQPVIGTNYCRNCGAKMDKECK